MTTHHVPQSSKWTPAQRLTLLGCAIALFAGTSAITTMTFGIFLLPVSRDLGWTRDIMPTAFGVFTVFSAIGTPLLGRLIDRHDPRLILGVGSALYAAATASIALLPPSQPVLFALYAAWGLSSVAQLPLGYTKIVSVWFRHDRGLAMGLTLLGSAIGAVLIPILAQALIRGVGWRLAYAGLGLTVLMIALPAIFLLIRWPPDEGVERAVADRAGRGPEEPGYSAGDALRSRRFWFILFAMFLVANCIVGLSLTLFPILKDNGLSDSGATAVVTLSGVSMMAGRVVGGIVMDRFAKERVAAFFFVLPLGAAIALAQSHGIAAGIAAAAIIGLCSGAEVAVASILIADVFGLRSFGQIFSWIFVGFIAGSGTGPWLMARSFVMFGTYEPGLMVLAAFSITAAILVICAGKRPRRPVMTAAKRTGELTSE